MTTTAQDRRINQIRDELTSRIPGHEVKTEKVSMVGTAALVLITVGLVGDEGTAGEIFGRDTVMVTLGPRGGIVRADSLSGPLFLQSCNGVLRKVTR